MTDPQDGSGPSGGRPEDQIGSVSEEAVKLFGALSEWARDHGSDVGQGLAGLADQAARAAKDVNDHLATGSAECAYCPVCRTVHAVRQASPEVRAHLVTAASSLLQAAAGALATAVPTDAGGRTGSVERIDLDPDSGDDSPEADR
ncbi:hypothetical protein [Nocardioides sp.]|uniref:hypothetical protein n=1 Tax=Nocardioides sp. TaxID=35761 RepID=UPI0031FE73BF|nr:hypothetical protein [Nocardioides sp.]